MVILMLVVLTATTLSGILMVGKGAGWLEDIHETLGSFMQNLVFVHIAGVFVDQLLTGENLIKAMITGHKELAEDAVQREVPVASVWKAFAFAILAVIGGAYLFQQMDYSVKVATFAADEEDARKRKNDDD